MAAKKFKPSPIGEPTSGSVEATDIENPLTEEQIKFVQTHILRQDPFVLGTCHTFQELRARHRRFLMEEERALLERNRLNAGFCRQSRCVSKSNVRMLE